METVSLTGMLPVIQVHPTRQCNLACAHCYTSSGPNIREHLPLEVLTAFVEDAVAHGYKQLALSGGEPLLYGQLEALLACARALGMRTTITSNGMLASGKRWARIAPLLDFAMISIDGTRNGHDEIRCCAGAYDKALSNLGVIRESGVPFGFIFTLTQHNVDSLESVVRLAAEQGARIVQVHPLGLHGRALATMSASRPDTIELLAAMAEASVLGQELAVAVKVDAVTSAELTRGRCRFVPKLPVSALTDIAPVLILLSDGSVIPLTHELDPLLWLGSLYDHRLSSLATTWLSNGSANVLAAMCARTWAELTASTSGFVFDWCDELALRTPELQ